MTEKQTKWNVLEWIKPYADPVTWWRRLNKTAQYAIIIFLAVRLIGCFAPKPAQNINTPKIVVLPFGRFSGNVTASPDQKITQKRAWWIPTAFVEPYGFTEKTTDDKSRAGAGARGGLRWEF